MIEFPYTPTTCLQHKWGGIVQKIHRITHQECKPREGLSLDSWWFDCDVLWHDTGKVTRSPVEPFKLVAQDGGENSDIRALTQAMGEYLAEHGAWYDTGRHRGWYAHRKAPAA